MSSHGVPGYYIGIISGTSVDAIDCALIESGRSTSRLLATRAGYYTDTLRQRILDLCREPQISLRALGELNVEIGQTFAHCASALLEQEQLTADRIAAIGSHGQTVFHHPTGDYPFSLQLGDPNSIAQLTGITTVADFRQRDVTAGGQGAPLAPLFHQHFFHAPDRCRAVLNIGGMANVTWLGETPDATPRGFDTGPGNVLMDGWIHRHRQQHYDANGEWAGSGEVIPELLTTLLDADYFRLPPPKSTGRELFNLSWLDARLGENFTDNAHSPADVQRTLLELTAVSIADAIGSSRPPGAVGLPHDLLVCGGGAHNSLLMARLQALLADFDVSSTERYGLHPDWVEAATFAWLASQTLARRPFNNHDLTGAREPVILGGIYIGRQSEKSE